MRLSILSAGVLLVLSIVGCSSRPLIERGWIGGVYSDFPRHREVWFPGHGTTDETLPAAIANDRSRAVLVERAFPGTPAHDSGLRERDLVIEVDGVSIASARDFYQTVDRTAAGSTLRLRVFRFGQFHDINVRAGREVQKDWYRLALGFGYPFRCDLFPNSDFDLFGVVGWSFRDPRRELAAPRNALVRSAGGGDDSRRFEAEQYAGDDWSVRIAIFKLSHGPEVRLQESVAARTTASPRRVTRP